MTGVVAMQAPEALLQRVLLVDAATSALCGVVMLADADWLASLTALPVSLLREAGIILLPFVALVTLVASARRSGRRASRP